MTRAAPGFDSTRYRSVLGHFATGIVAITAVDPTTERPAGLTANAFTSVSLEPPMIGFCVAHTSTTWPKLRAAGRVCVNVLAADQLGVCRQLARRGDGTTDKFRDIVWRPSPGGAPVLDNALAWIEATIEAEHPAGDHDFVLCRVHHLESANGRAPLLFYRGDYGSFS